MYFIYKLKNGKYVRLFDQKLLSADKKTGIIIIEGMLLARLLIKMVNI